jgi:hypothetical protein
MERVETETYARPMISRNQDDAARNDAGHDANVMG